VRPDAFDSVLGQAHARPAFACTASDLGLFGVQESGVKPAEPDPVLYIGIGMDS
jgi:hypothetical protein